MGICSSRCVLGKYLVLVFPLVICENKKTKGEYVMEIEFHFRFVRKPKTKKVTLVVESEE